MRKKVDHAWAVYCHANLSKNVATGAETIVRQRYALSFDQQREPRD